MTRLFHNMKLFFDGASKGNPGRSSYAWVLLDHNNKVIKKRSKVLDGIHTCNVAEYHGLISALRYLEAENIKNVVIHGDSQLVINQVRGGWDCLHPNLVPLHKLATCMLNERQLVWVRRNLNSLADVECNKVLRKLNHN